jgi:GntR family transcriptional regulator
MNIKPSKPAYIQIKDNIVKKIRTGTWKEDQKIPSELKLMELYNVGRGTIRDAMKLIVDEGYVYIKKGVGTFVTQNEVGVSLEPFISLTYFIKMRGLKIESEILEQKEFVVDEECSKETGLAIGSNALLVTRLRILEGKPLAVEMFRFSEAALKIFKDYDFTQPISHYMFDVKKIGVSKMNMDFIIQPSTKNITKILKLDPKEKMIKSSRTVFAEPNNELFYYLTFYCAEKLSYIGTEKFI